MSILVTGGAGFIGSHLVERLLRDSREPVVVLDNFSDYYDPERKRQNLAALKHPQLTVVEGDICDPAVVDGLFERHTFSLVYHLAAYPGVPRSVQIPLVYEHVNIRGTLVLLEAARRFRPRQFVFASSSTVYGKDAPIPFLEDRLGPVPASPYGATKRAAELLCLLYHQLHGLSVLVVRPFNVYGARLRPDLGLYIFADCIWHEKPLPLFGDGSVRRDFTYIDDFIDGIVAAGHSAHSGTCINLGHNRPVEIRELIAMLEREFGKRAVIERRPPRPEDMPATWADLTRAHELLGYQPRVPLKEGLREFAKWFRTL